MRKRLPDFKIMAHEGGKVVSLMYRPSLPPRNIPGTHFYQRLSRPQGHSAAGRIISMKNSNDTIGNRTCDLPACSAVPQPTATPRTPTKCISYYFLLRTAALRLIVRSCLGVPTFATRRLHACHHARSPSGGRQNCGREISGNLA